MTSKPMSPDDVLRELRKIRFSPKAGRPLTFAWLARQTGYNQASIYRAIARSCLATPMAHSIANTLSLLREENAQPNLGRLGAGLDGRGRRASVSRRLGAGARARRERTSDD